MALLIPANVLEAATTVLWHHMPHRHRRQPQTTTGSAIADADLGQVPGLQADDLVVGDNAVVQAQAGSQIDVSATTVNGMKQLRRCHVHG